ncbi:hypothetical protein AAF712_008155 [Marasmius tenuissimus]|uniref:Uncharacterized protein n=1 Tax=Marasmius tenuissimus TaxID=585030 RepID=A0ABR2ZX96_9AGAR
MEDVLMQIENDWDNYKGVAADTSVLKSPVKDFKKALGDALAFEGTFAFSTEDSDAPNPYLNLDGVGFVGVPFTSNAQAKLIVKTAKKKAGGLWSIPAEKVQVTNPRWNAWLRESVLPEMHSALSRSLKKSASTDLRLVSLTLQSVDPKARDHVEKLTPAAKESYASLSVILPSLENSGSVEISHEGLSLKVPFESHGTTTISSVPGCMQTTHPARDGHVLSLQYEILWQGKQHSNPRVHFKGHTSVTTELTRMFRSWKDSKKNSDTPHLLGFLLKTECPAPSASTIRVATPPPRYYSNSTLNSQKTPPPPPPPEQYVKPTSLKKANQRVLAQIAPVAKAYGFDVHLGQVQYAKHGFVELDNVECESCDDKIYDRPEDARFMNDDCGEYREKVVLQHVFSLDGVPMQMKARAMDGTVQEAKGVFVNGALTDGVRISEIVGCSSYGDRGAYLDRTWTSMALLISPKDSPFARSSLRLTDPGKICSQLDSSSSSRPSGKEGTFRRQDSNGKKAKDEDEDMDGDEDHEDEDEGEDRDEERGQ